VTVRDRGASERARARALSATASHRSLRKTPLILRSTDAPRAGAQRGLVRRSAEMTGLETPDARRSAPARMLRREAQAVDCTPKAATRYGHAVHRTRLDPVSTRDIPQSRHGVYWSINVEQLLRIVRAR
jgi:hypothetical protein